MQTTNTSRSARGFTILEVLIGVLVLSIGLIGVFGLQFAAVDSNRASFDIRVATELAETTLERLKRDAIMWQGPGAYEEGTWLDAALGCVTTVSTDPATGVEPTRCLPPRPTGASGSDPTYNDMGLPRVTNNALPAASSRFMEKNSRYCIGYVSSWIVPPTVATVNVRVSWPRDTEGERLIAGDCSNLAALTDLQLRQHVASVSVTGVVRSNL